MKFKDIMVKCKNKMINIIKRLFNIKVLTICFLRVLLIATIFLLIYGILFLLPNIKKLVTNFSIILPQTSDVGMFEIILNTVNFVIVYISILFTIMGILVVFSNRELNRIIIIRKEIESEVNKLKNFRDVMRKNFSLEAQLTTAKIFFIQEDFTEAWENIKNLSDDFNHEVPLYKARILLNKEKESRVFSTVMKFLDKALSFPNLTNEDKSLIYRYIGRAYLEEKKNYKKALEYMEKAIDENRTYWTAHNEKAIILRRQGRMDEAIKILEEILEEDKSYSYAHYNLACYYSLKIKKESNLKDKAINCYKEAIKLDQKFKDTAKDDSDLDNIRKEIKDLQITHK